MDSFDYVIVGAGSAGCVLANRLTEDAANSVCVLEAGPRDWHPYIHLPAGFIKTFYNPRIHPEFTAADSPMLFFEGTYTAEFADHPAPTPRYNYNQILYRLDLDDPALAVAH